MGAQLVEPGRRALSFPQFLFPNLQLNSIFESSSKASLARIRSVSDTVVVVGSMYADLSI